MNVIWDMDRNAIVVEASEIDAALDDPSEMALLKTAARALDSDRCLIGDDYDRGGWFENALVKAVMARNSGGATLERATDRKGRRYFEVAAVAMAEDGTGRKGAKVMRRYKTC